MIDWIDMLGYFAAICTTISFIPQTIKIFKTKDTTAISLTMYTLFTLGVASWLLYGICISNYPIIIANFITLVLAMSILIMKIIYN